jgi:glycosyltransferase involved in cell wall biosynthesis
LGRQQRAISNVAAPVAAVIPTFGRGFAVLEVIERIEACDPAPREIWVHVDQSDGTIETRLHTEFPRVRVLSSKTRIGPGAGRHKCLLACSAPYAASFDDDSFPLDGDYFDVATSLFNEYPTAAVFGSTIQHRAEPERQRTGRVDIARSFVGCGHIVRVHAYCQVRGYLPIPVAYGMEERDVALQLAAANWQIWEAASLRVFHDTDRSHHASPEITAGTIANTALLAYLHYPARAWGRGVLQVGNAIRYAIVRRRFQGILSGLAQAPLHCLRYRKYRKPLPWSKLDLIQRQPK